MDLFLLQEAIKSKKAIMISACCTVSYNGRAQSFLAEGDRIIIIKPDGTLIIHQPKGSAPINYMKEGTTFRVSLEGSRTIVNCTNEKEYMTITVERFHSFSATELSDGQKLQITGSEKDMSVMIYNNPILIEEGFKPLSMEEHTKFGFIDVFGYDQSNILVIVECKRYIADMGAVEQLNRYVEKIKSTKGLGKVRGIIAAPKLTPSASEMLKQFGFEFRKILPPKYMEKFDSWQKRLEF